jgi:hypothetical protein
MLPSRFDECFTIAKELAEDFSEISLSLKPLIKPTSELYDYTDTQMEMLRSYYKPVDPVKFSMRAKGEMMVRFDDGSTDKMPASRIVSRGLNSFLGWECNIGLESLAINANGEIFRGNCRVGGQIGSVQDGIYSIPDKPIRCMRRLCFCATEICSEKKLPLPS